MILLSHTGGVAWTNCFLIADEAVGEAVLFDAPDHTVEPLLSEVGKRGWDLTGLWLTHGHFDHLADHAVVRQAFPKARQLIHSLDEAKAQKAEAQTRMFGLPMAIPPFKADAHVEDAQQLLIGSIKVQALHTPGHSPGHVSYYLPGEGILVGGDLIIGGSVGRTDLPDSRLEDLQASIRRVMALPPDTRLLGGHGPETTLAQEQARNPYVRFALEGEQAL